MRNSNFGIGVLHVKVKYWRIFLWRHFSARSSLYWDRQTDRVKTIPRNPLRGRGNKNTMQVYLVTAMTHVIALEGGPSIQGALKPITPVQLITNIVIYFHKDTLSFYHLTCICHPACIFPPLLGDRVYQGQYTPPPPQQAIHNSARVAICECLAC